MESLDGTEWDFIISGTGVPQSLLALALSRSGKKILHVDQNSYYGGDEAALSLQEAEEWANKHAERETTRKRFSHATVLKFGDAAEEGPGKKLGSSRAYSLGLAPQLLYARSDLIPALVSSRVHEQVEFQAVGSIFIMESRPFQPPLSRVPSSREDIFGDNSIDLKSKRALMKFLSFVNSLSEERDAPETATSAAASSRVALSDEERRQPFSTFLQERFGLPRASHGPLLSLVLSPEAPISVTTASALQRLERHIRSFGVFGAGFAAVLPKWGGLAEIAQVACRACAVGGGVYCLGKGIKKVISGDADVQRIVLDGDETVEVRWVAGGATDLPPLQADPNNATPPSLIYRSIAIVASPLTSLFPLTSEGGVTPAGAVVVVPDPSDSNPPVHMIVHSSESGECPSNQCVLYTSLLAANHYNEPSVAFDRMHAAVQALLQSAGELTEPKVLWRMQWAQVSASWNDTTIKPSSNHTIPLPCLGADLAFDDGILQAVKDVWVKVTGEDETTFLKFETREHVVSDDD